MSGRSQFWTERFVGRKAGIRVIEPNGISHIGIAVRSIAAHRDFYEQVLGAAFGGIEDVPSQQVRVAIFTVGAPGHEMRVELIEATVPDSAVARFIEKHGEGIHHIAYSVDRLEEKLSALEAAGVRLVDHRPREGARHQRIAFLHPTSTGGVLTELCEETRSLGAPDEPRVL